MPGPADDIANAAWADVNGGGGTPPPTANDIGPVGYDPDELLAYGVPSPLVNSYRRALAEYQQAQAAAKAQPWSSGSNPALSQAGMRLRAAEVQVGAYFRPTAEPKPTYFEDSLGNRYELPPSDLGPGEAGPRSPAQQVFQDPTAEAKRKIMEAQALSATTAAARLEWEKERAAISDAFESRRLSLEEAKAKASESYQRIQAQLEAQQNEITQRGQDMNMATSLASDASRLAEASLPYLAPAGTAEDLARVREGFANGTVVATPARAMSFPFDPTSLPAQVTAAVLRGVSPTAQAVAQAGPPAAAGPGLTLPRVATPELPPPTFGPAA